MKAFLFAFLILFTAACNYTAPADENASAAAPEKIDSLKKEVMAAHDRVMPKMNPMGQQQRQLRAQAPGSADSLGFIDAAAKLKQAQDRMMNWMREFKAPDEQNWSEAEKTAYLEKELTKMQALEKFTEASMATADSLLQRPRAKNADTTAP
jgi:hypothetical protein